MQLIAFAIKFFSILFKLDNGNDIAYIGRVSSDINLILPSSRSRFISFDIWGHVKMEPKTCAHTLLYIKNTLKKLRLSILTFYNIITCNMERYEIINELTSNCGYYLRIIFLTFDTNIINSIIYLNLCTVIANDEHKVSVKLRVSHFL